MKKTRMHIVLPSPHVVLNQRQTIVKTLPYASCEHLYYVCLQRSARNQKTTYDAAIHEDLHDSDDVTPEHTYHYNPSIKMSGTCFHYGETLKLYAKGDPSTLLHYCKLSDTEIETIQKQYRMLESQGYDVCALSYKEYTEALPPSSLDTSSLHYTMRFIGLVAFTQTVNPKIRRILRAHINNNAQVTLLSRRSTEATYHILHQIDPTVERRHGIDYTLLANAQYPSHDMPYIANMSSQSIDDACMTFKASGAIVADSSSAVEKI